MIVRVHAQPAEGLAISEVFRPVRRPTEADCLNVVDPPRKHMGWCIPSFVAPLPLP